MSDEYITVDRNRIQGNVKVNGVQYFGYSVQDAIKKYKADNGLTGKRGISIIYLDESLKPKKRTKVNYKLPSNAQLRRGCR